MDIERKKVESIGEFAPKTKATLAALLGLSAALSVPAEPQGRIAVIPATPADSTITTTQDSTVSSSSPSDTTNIQNVSDSTIIRWLSDPRATAGVLEEDVSEEDMVKNAVDAAVERNATR